VTEGPPQVAWQVEPRGDDDVPGDRDLARALRAALEHGGRPGREVSLVVVDDATIGELHGRFLGDPTPTDVITFDLGDGDEPGPDAELYVSLDTARRVAGERGVPLARELTLYVVHGALHLCGLDDHDPADRAAMRVAEREVLGGLGFPPDPAPHDDLDRA